MKRAHSEGRDLTIGPLSQVPWTEDGFGYALVWSTEGEEAQLSVRVPQCRRIPARELLDQISAFPGLQSLQLDSNPVEGMSTQFLRDLATQHSSTLRHLRISVPSSVEAVFSGFPRLQTLDLALGEDPSLDLSSMEDLRELSLSLGDGAVRIVGLEDLTRLRKLVLAGHEMRKLPSRLCHLSHLQHLELDMTILWSLPDEIGNLQQLSTFRLYSQEMQYLPGTFAQLQSLQHLKIVCPSLLAFPPGMEHQTRLETLDIDIGLSGGMRRGPPLSLANMSLLTMLRVNHASGPYPVDFGRNPSIQHLTIDGSPFPSCLPAGVTELSGLRFLHLKHFAGLSSTDRLGALAHLEELHIVNLPLKSLPSSITQLQRLRMLPH